MYIRKVWIENIRCFGGDAQKVELDLQRPNGSYAGWTVVAGRNGTGKSTFLKALALAIAGPAAARSLVPSFEGWVRSGAAQGYIGVELEADQVQDGWRGRGNTPADGSLWAELKLEPQPDGPEPSVGSYPDESTIKGPLGRGPWAENPKGWFVAGYGPFRRLSGHTTDSVRLMAGPGRLARLVTLFREDASLSECVEWLRNEVYLRRLENKPGAAQLEANMIQLLNDGLLPDDVKIHHIDSDGLWVERNGLRLPLRDLADGYRTVIALVLDIVKQLHASAGTLVAEPNNHGHIEILHAGVVLIDEMDIHLHVAWQQRIGVWLKQHFPAIQFIVTTHSPFICQAADPKGLIRLPVPGTNERAEHVSDTLFKEIVHGGADAAAMTDLFGLDHAHSDESEALRERVAVLEAKFIRNRITSDEEIELEQLRHTLPTSGSMSVEMALRAAKAAE